uniref:MTSS I-BAR domain containing 1 n=1 Tax=Fundulus heteroclitus TaxID=8078 RepID=A0A3Q2QLQ2_FUNHE
MCSSLNSVNSSDSRSSGSHCHSPTSHFRYRASSSSSSSVLPQQTPARLSSVSSHDSGFISQDAYQSKSPSPMPPDNLQGEKEAHEELARALARGLQLDIHGSSRDSLQGSSGYSSQTNTPCCSEDTIPSQVSDCDYYSVGADPEGEHQSDYDKSSTIPRNSDITHSYRRMFQSKRPASTAGLPSNHSAVITPGVATIRRTPSSKPNLRRPSGGLNLGPIPIKPPMIPVKTPTVPDHPGFPSRAEDGQTPRTPLSPPTTPLSPGSSGPLSPKSIAWGNQQPDEESDPPTPPPQPGGRLSEWEHRPLPELLEEMEYCEVEDFLVAIRRGVKLKKTTSNDRSAPMIH